MKAFHEFQLIKPLPVKKETQIKTNTHTHHPENHSFNSKKYPPFPNADSLKMAHLQKGNKPAFLPSQPTNHSTSNLVKSTFFHSQAASPNSR